MDDEKPLTEQESLALITRMINKAKCDYEDTGVSALIWGTVISFCSLATFAGALLNTSVFDYVWLLTIVAVAVQVYVSIRERRRKRYTGYHDSAMGGMWISFGIAMFLISFYTGKFSVPHANALFLIVYGVPTFATGFSMRFTPMTVGGIACWLLGIAAMYTPFPYIMLYSALGAQLAWFIPGLILRRRYLKAKRGNV